MSNSAAHDHQNLVRMDLEGRILLKCPDCAKEYTSDDLPAVMLIDRTLRSQPKPAEPKFWLEPCSAAQLAASPNHKWSVFGHGVFVSEADALRYMALHHPQHRYMGIRGTLSEKLV